uniref:Uncharacterized protein n=1 Tax=Glossina brevipalpis TaxID=37001 RepID=A0A1A9WIL3_9MUSC
MDDLYGEGYIIHEEKYLFDNCNAKNTMAYISRRNKIRILITIGSKDVCNDTYPREMLSSPLLVLLQHLTMFAFASLVVLHPDNNKKFAKVVVENPVLSFAIGADIS